MGQIAVRNESVCSAVGVLVFAICCRAVIMGTMLSQTLGKLRQASQMQGARARELASTATHCVAFAEQVMAV